MQGSTEGAGELLNIRSLWASGGEQAGEMNLPGGGSRAEGGCMDVFWLSAIVVPHNDDGPQGPSQDCSGAGW